jgi:membrane protein YqaA with SNARE-associated domain
VVNWLLGRSIAQLENRRWFPVSRDVIARAEAWYRRYGCWSLLLSWVPVIGDPLPVFLALVTIAKVGRYIAVAVLASHWA